MRPFVEFGFMPQKLASGEKTIFWWKGNITPPRDYGKWEALIRALVQHWTNRYGRDEVRRWYFEVWNEPNLKDAFGLETRRSISSSTTRPSALSKVSPRTTASAVPRPQDARGSSR